MTTCYCGGHYRCGTCRHDVCYCTCDPTPTTREAVTAGYVNPSQARLNAWHTKQELTR